MKDYTVMLSCLETLTPFAFIRWGDGEIRCVLGDNQPNCDGHRRDQTLKKALINILKEQNQEQTLAMGVQSTRHSAAFRPSIERSYPNIVWDNADILHEASQSGEGLKGFFRTMQRLADEGVNTMLISGNSKLYRTVEISTFIPLIATDSFYRHTVEDIKSYVEKHDPKVVLFASSMASNVWIAELWKDHPDKIFIDVGSVLDPYAGVISRAYHHQIANRLGIPEKDRIYTGSQQGYPERGNVLSKAKRP